MKKQGTAWSGGLLGPYRITRRHRGIGGGLGRLYEARNEETGNAALVLTPAPDGDLRPEEDWQVRASSSVAPPYLALEVERAPVDGQAPELTWMLDLWATALVRVDERPDAQSHLTGGSVKPQRHPSIQPRWRGARLGLAALLVLGVALWPLSTAQWRGEQPDSPLTGDTVRDNPLFFGSNELQATQPLAFPLPSKPFEGQRKPPCDPERAEVEINGGCWMELARRAPCPKGAAEYQGKCYGAVKAEPPLPRSIQP
jgi:hypothetical protein